MQGTVVTAPSVLVGENTSTVKTIDHVTPHTNVVQYDTNPYSSQIALRLISCLSPMITALSLGAATLAGTAFSLERVTGATW